MAWAASAGGTYFSAASTYRQGKQEKKYLYEQAAEERRQSEFERQQSLENQRQVEIEKQVNTGRAKAVAAKSGIMVGTGSTAKRRAYVESRYENEKFQINRQSTEMQKRHELNAYWLEKRGKQALSNAKWGMWANILSGSAQTGMNAYKSGQFSNTQSTNTGGYSGAYKTADMQWGVNQYNYGNYGGGNGMYSGAKAIR